MFIFNGPLLISKSWLNRAVIIQHFNKNKTFLPQADSDDVINLKKAIDSIGQSSSFYLGLGGTSFRFFSFLISRYPGRWALKAHERLLERPQQETIDTLNCVGVKAEFVKNELLIESHGWKIKNKIICSADLSSQFASGLLLSCWNLDFDAEINIKKPMVSSGYLQMTLEMLRQAGMQLIISENEDALSIKIPKNQKVMQDNLEAELDISSAFSLIVAAVLNGNVKITNWKSRSIQPDYIFLEIFKKMNISFNTEGHQFLIVKQEAIMALEFNLNRAPDLFPSLAVLCAFAEGVSILHGARQLKDKESNRLQKTQELLWLMGVRTEALADGLKIYGKSSTRDLNKKIKFNPDHDHRMAMAAALFKLKGYNIEITQPEVVRKSYPNFWKDIGFFR